MLHETFNGEACKAGMGEVVFAVFEPGSNLTKRIQHVALLNTEDFASLNNFSDRVDVLEFITHPSDGCWQESNYGYQVDLVGKMVKNGTHLPAFFRYRIINIAQTLLRRFKNLINPCGPPVDCVYDLEKYKHVRPNPNDPANAIEISFTCCGFIEYCYEKAQQDIVKDGDSGEYLPLVIWNKGGKWSGKRIRVLFPGYQIKAFKFNKYPLDFDDMKRQGLKPEDYQNFPFK